MPPRSSKKPRRAVSDTPESTPPGQARSPSSSLAALPGDVLTRIARSLAYDDLATSPSPASRLVPLALTSKALSRAAVPVIDETLSLKSSTEVAEAAKLYKPKGGKQAAKKSGAATAKEVRALKIELHALYSSPPALSTLRTSCTTLLSLRPSSLSSLTLSLSAASSPLQPITALFPVPSTSFTALTSLVNLASFTLAGAFLWLHDLVPLLSSWAHLSSLSLASLRGDCTRPPLPDAERSRTLRRLVVRESTLAGEMVEWLLEGQTALVELEMGLPGCEGRAWDALGEVVGSVEVLKVWDRWGGGAAGSKRGKGNGKGKAVVPAPAHADVDELASDDEVDDGDQAPTLPSSPLLALVSRTDSLRSLFLSTSLLPSAPVPSSFDALLPHLDTVEELVIEDSPSSGLRKTVEAVLASPLDDDDAGAHLPELKRLVSVVKKLKVDAEKHKSKGLAKLCEKRGIEWVVREGA